MSRLLRKHRGIAVGVAVAIIVLVAVSAYVMYKLWETYAVAYKAITEYSITTQKPIFEITGIMQNGTNIVITITNRGPSAAHVTAVHVYKYVTSDIPRDVDTFPMNMYVPVGDSFTISLPMDKIREYMFYGRPLRILIETDKGLSLIATEPPTSTAVINVIFPTYGVIIAPNTIPKITISCPAGTQKEIELKIPSPDPDVSIVKKGNTYTITTKVFGVGTCDVALEGEFYFRAIAGEWEKATPQNNIPIRGTIYPWSGTIHAGLAISPGTVSTVDIKIPELVPKEQSPPPPPPSNTQIIDFSWYFMPVIYGDVEKFLGLVPVGVQAGTVNGEVYRTDPYDTALKIVENGGVIPTSPEGCIIYPSAGASDDVKQAIDDLFYRFQWEGSLGADYAIHTGLPIVIKDYPNSCSAVYVSDKILDVAVPIYLSSGKYIVIPVFSYDDVDSYPGLPPTVNGLPVTIYAYVSSPDGKMYPWDAGYVSDENASPGEGMTMQFASPIIVNAGSDGTYYLHIIVKNNKLSSGSPDPGRADWIWLIISKIIVIRAGEYSGVCAIQADKIPTFPWAVVDVMNGKVTPTAKIVFAASEKVSSYQEARSDAPKVALYSTAYHTGGVLVADQSGIKVNTFTVTDVRPHYFANGYKLQISPYIAGPASGEISLTLAWDAFNLYTSIPAIYPGFDGTWDWYRVSIAARTPKGYENNLQTEVKITFGEAGKHYVIIGIVYATYQYDYLIYPSFSIADKSGINSITVLYPDSGNSFTNSDHVAEIVMIVDVASAGATLTLRFNNGENVYDEDAMIGINHIIVVKDPGIQYDVNTPDWHQAGVTGIYLTNLHPIPGINYITAYLIRTDNGAQVAGWLVDTSKLGTYNASLLNFLGFNEFKETYSVIRNDPNLVEMVPYVLLIYGAECQGNVAGGAPGSGTGGGSGGSSQPTIRWYRTQITVTSSVSVQGYQLKITIPSGWDGWTIGAQKGSVYITDDAGNPLYFWIQEWDANSKTATIWVKVDLTASTTTTLWLYWSPDTSTSQYASYNNPNNVFLFFDDLETWTGWNKFRSGIISQDTSIAYEGSASLKKSAYCDPSGGYKVLPTPIPSSTDFVVEVYVRRSQLTGCNADRFGLLDKAPTGSNYVLGYGPNLGHGTTSSFNIERRYGPGPSARAVTSTSYYTGTLLNKWLRIVMIWDYRTPYYVRIYGYVYDGSTRIMSVSGSIYSSIYIPSQFSVFYVFGGYPYNIDLIIIRKYVSPAPTVSVSTTSEQV